MQDLDYVHMYSETLTAFVGTIKNYVAMCLEELKM